MPFQNNFTPVHPGQIIREDILPQLNLSVSAAAEALGISRHMLRRVLAARKPLSAVLCLKLARFFGCTPEFWMRLQVDYDLKKAVHTPMVMESLARITPLNPLR